MLCYSVFIEHRLIEHKLLSHIVSEAKGYCWLQAFIDYSQPPSFVHKQYDDYDVQHSIMDSKLLMDFVWNLNYVLSHNEPNQMVIVVY